MTSVEFEALYLKHHETWRGVVIQMTHNEATADDVLQEVMLRLLELFKIENLDNTKNPESFIFRKILQYVKRYVYKNKQNGHKIEHNLDTGLLNNDTGEFWQRQITAPEPVDDLNAETPLELGIQEALATLTHVEHDIICMKIYANMPMREIAKVLKLDLRYAENLYQYTLPKLRLALESVGISDQTFGDSRMHGKAETAV